MPRITLLQFLETLYPTAWLSKGGLPGRLVLWTKSRRSGRKHTDWPHTPAQAARLAHSYRKSRDVYFGIALQDRDRALAIARRRRPRIGKRAVRGSEASATLLPALWADLDIAGPGHRSQRLPPDRESALRLLEAVPKPPSIVVDSGGGLHVYWLLQEPLILANAADRQRAKDLVARVQAALRLAAEDQGWGVDHTANLAQLLRLPGTFNHKTQKSRLVTVEHFPLAHNLDDLRFRLEDFDQLPEPQTTAIDLPLLNGRRREAGSPADFRRVLAGCAWLRHCYDDRTSLPEPEWYAALSIVGRCASNGVEGRRLAHRISRDHPGYRASDTDDKLDQALERFGPRSCRHIAESLGQGHRFCRHCPHFGQIKSPIVLGRRKASTPAASSPAPRRPSAVPPGSESVREDDRPQILITTREDEVNDQAMAALANRESNLFQRGGVLVHVIRPGGQTIDGRPGPSTSAPTVHAAPASIKPVQQSRLRELLARHCAFFKHAGHKDGGELRPAHPPRWTVRALAGRGAWPELPELVGLVEGPVLRPDGSVLQSPGFDPATGLIYAPNLEFEKVPEKPGIVEASAALGQLREMVGDFPFRSEAHLAAWLSSLLTPLARAAFRGPAPLNLIDANVRGSGKSLLADVCSTLLTGRSAPRMSYSSDEEEIRKQITSVALEGTQLVLIDNVCGVFGSATLDRALTAESWQDRLLGSNLQVQLPLAATWFATGNNVVLKGDTPRRCLHIRLESRRERPEHRTDFRHPRLLSWVRRERGHLLPAALTLLRAYAAAGRPPQRLAGWGSFEGWSDLVRATVVWLGLPDPADTRIELETAADSEISTVRDLIHGLAELLTVRGGAATSRDILEELSAHHATDRYRTLRLALAESFPRLAQGRLPTASQLSVKLGSLRGRRLDGVCLEQGPRTYRGVRWSVRRLQEVA